MPVLGIDIETYSSVSLPDCGVYRYVEAPDFEILLFAYAYDDEPVHVVDLTAFEDIPACVLRDLHDQNVVKTAYNANFERVCISRQLGIECDPLQWRCTSVWALTLGLPGYLDGVASVLKLESQKDMRGKSLIRYFSSPCVPTEVNGGRTRNYPHHAPDRWQQYKDYCGQDVVVEREVRKRLERFPVPDHEWAMWALDQRINDRGVQLDNSLVQHAIACDAQYGERLVAEACELTGLANPNSITQLKAWFAAHGLDAEEGLSKERMPLLLDAAPDDQTRRVLELRQEMSKTSVDKFNAMDRSVCSDGRARGLLQFQGANRTGRWSGRLIQVQNLPQNKLPDLDLARDTLRSGDYDLLEVLFGAPPFVLTQLIRTALVPSEGCRFLVADFNAIEARVIAWLAGEQWVLDVFRSHGRIYEATASQMFGIPLETIAKGHENYKYRAPGKVATLACGFGGGPNALERMDSKREIDPAEYPGLVRQWRKANPNIVQLWYAAEDAAITAVREKTTVKVAHGVQYRYAAGILFADLPSGRSLAYVNPRLKPDPKFGKEGLVYDGMDQVKKKWMSHRTYSGKLVENLVQAIARDCLAVSITRVAEAGYPIVMHVHDEIVADMPYGTGSVQDLAQIMGRPIDWAPGLPLRADGFETSFYKKD